MANDVAWKVAFVGECMIELFRSPQGSISLNYAGDTFNTAAYFSRLGNRFGMTAEYVTALGDDSFSAAMRAVWAAENVGHALVRTLPGRLPGLYCIEVDSAGERSFSYWRDEAAVRDMFGQGGETVLQQLGSFDAVYCSGISLAVLRGVGRDRFLARLGELRAMGTQIVFDCNFRPRLWPGQASPAENARPWYERIIAHAHTVFISRDEIAAVGLEPHVDDATILATVSQWGATEVVLKNGSGECLVSSQGATWRVPARRMEGVVDTTAAGDSFAAAYMVGRRLKLPPAEAASRAHGMAARVIAHPGAIIPQQAMPDLFSDYPA